MLYNFFLALSLSDVEASLESFFSALVARLAPVLFFKIGPFPLIVLVLGLGALIFTFYFKFINIRGINHSLKILRGDYDDPNDEGQISAFQALTSALSATVGLGNISSVAVAIATGGPGAVLWMMLMGFFGMTSKFTETCLSLLYRNEGDKNLNPDDGITQDYDHDNKQDEVYGGPMYYLRDGLKERGLEQVGKVLAVIFAVLIVGASFGGGNMFQANQNYELMAEQFPTLKEFSLLYGVGLAFLVGLVIIGGIQAIGRVTEKIVPFMVGTYLAASLYIVLANITSLGSVISSVFHCAFSNDTMWSSINGGVLGVMALGIQRAAFSNEAGVGSSAIAHSAVKTKEPVREGFVAMLEPFIDTVVICTMTASILLVTSDKSPSMQSYRALQQQQVSIESQLEKSNLSPEQALSPERYSQLETELKSVKSKLKNELKGSVFTKDAFASEIEWFPYILTFVVFLFSYSTMISWYYYGATGWGYLFGRGRSALGVYQACFLLAVVFGCVSKLKAVMDFSDMMLLSCAFPNIIGAILMLPILKEKVQEYCKKYL